MVPNLFYSKSCLELFLDILVLILGLLRFEIIIFIALWWRSGGGGNGCVGVGGGTMQVGGGEGSGRLRED